MENRLLREVPLKIAYKVAVSTEPVYSDDQFAHNYSNPYELFISVHTANRLVMIGHDWSVLMIKPKSIAVQQLWSYHFWWKETFGVAL